MKESQLSGLLIAGLLAILGTVAGGVVKGYWDTQLAEKEFHSKLILRALEPDDGSERAKSLKFLVRAKLISDPNIEEGLKNIYQDEGSIPQFQPVNALPRDFSSVKPPELKKSIALLVALRVYHGQVIDAITPVFVKLAPDLSIKEEIDGKRYGGEGGDETVLKKDGYIITGIDVTRGTYFGGKDVIHLRAIFNKLTPSGIDPNNEFKTEKLGSGEYATDLKTEQFRAEPGNYISDFGVKPSKHTDGKEYLGEFIFEQEKLPIED